MGNKVVISGSFRKAYPAITKAISLFNRRKVKVLSPATSVLLRGNNHFLYLASDKIREPELVEQLHLDAILKADALYVINPSGYIGITTALEIGWARGFGKPIFYSEVCKEDLFNSYGRVASITETVNHLKYLSQAFHETLSPYFNLDLLQNYVHKMVIKRGFDKESPRDILLLLVEEVGELAKAIRKLSGIKSQSSKITKENLEDEFADAFIYLVDLANSLDIDLYQALARKEAKNSKHTWT